MNINVPFPLDDPLKVPVGARLLSGVTSRRLEGGFALPLFVRRYELASSQLVDRHDDGSYNVQCRFYEPLRSATAVAEATDVSASFNADFFRVPPRAELSLEIFSTVYDAPNGILQLPTPTDSSRGDHAVASISSLEQGIIILMGWPNWGNDGFGFAPSEYLAKYLKESWAIRVMAGPPPHGYPDDSSRRRALYSPWDPSEESPCTVFGTGAQFDCVIRWVIGAADGRSWLQCLAISHDQGTTPRIIGWLHGRMEDKHYLTIQELFVWPAYRERGVGSLLASRSLLWAMFFGATEVRWLKSQSDALAPSSINSHVPSWISSMQMTESSELGVSTESSPESVAAIVGRFADMDLPEGVRRFFIFDDDGKRATETIGESPHPRQYVVQRRISVRDVPIGSRVLTVAPDSVRRYTPDL